MFWDLRPVAGVETGVNFRPARGARGKGGNQALVPGSKRVGVVTPSLHPEVSWYPICVTWTWVGHQAINGLDEGVWNCTVGDLGAKG